MKKNLIKIIISILLILSTILISFFVQPLTILLNNLETENNNKYINDISDKHKLIYLGSFETDEEDLNENKIGIKDFISNTNITEYVEYKYENLNNVENLIFYNNIIGSFSATTDTFILLNRTGEIVQIFEKNTDMEEIKAFLKDYFAKFV